MTIPHDTFKDAVALIKGLEFKYLVDLTSILSSEIELRKVSAQRDAKLQILKIAQEAGISIDEIRGMKIKIAPQKPQREVRFKNPNNPAETWSGMGRKPIWFINCLSAGMPADQLRVAA